MFLIWYGAWPKVQNAGDPPLTRNIIANLVNDLSGTPFYNIITTYDDYTNTFAINNVIFAGQADIDATDANCYQVCAHSDHDCLRVHGANAREVYVMLFLGTYTLMRPCRRSLAQTLDHPATFYSLFSALWLRTRYPLL